VRTTTRKPDLTVQYNVQVTAASGNAKTGPIPTTSRGLETCPATCPFRPDGEIGGCYGTGRIFALANKWSSWYTFAAALAKLKGTKPTRKMIARDRVVGDIVGEDGKPDYGYLTFIAEVFATVDRRAFGYTHSTDVVGTRVPTNYTLNMSCETVGDVEDAFTRGLPAVIVGDAADLPVKIGKARVVQCPAESRDEVTCASCGLCALKGRMDSPETSPVIRFTPHGTSVKKARAAVKSRNNR